MKTLAVRSDPGRRRAHAYEPVGAQLDAIMKAFVALAEQGFKLPPETLAWIDGCKGVKAKFPKTDDPHASR